MLLFQVSRTIFCAPLFFRIHYGNVVDVRDTESNRDGRLNIPKKNLQYG